MFPRQHRLYWPAGQFGQFACLAGIILLDSPSVSSLLSIATFEEYMLLQLAPSRGQQQPTVTHRST